MFDNTWAEREGWAIYEGPGSTPFAILSERPGQTDAEAVAHVVKRAEQGSLYHVSALCFLQANSPGELEEYPAIHRVLQERID